MHWQRCHVIRQPAHTRASQRQTHKKKKSSTPALADHPSQSPRWQSKQLKQSKQHMYVYVFVFQGLPGVSQVAAAADLYSAGGLSWKHGRQHFQRLSLLGRMQWHVTCRVAEPVA